MITVENQGRIVHIFGRDKNKKLYVKTDDIFYPYFYIKSNSSKKYKSLFGENCEKIVCEIPKQVKEQRQNYPESFEADIIYTNRYIIDKFDSIEKEDLRICYFDMEIDVIKGFPSITQASNKILAISCYDNFDKEMTTIDDEDEFKLIENFIKYIQKTDPDIITAWNGDGFDFPYLLNRLDRLRINKNQLSRIVNGQFLKSYSISDGKYFNNKIGGRVLLDLLWCYRKLSQGQGRESFSLEYISQYELGEGKEKYEGFIGDLYYKDRKKFIEYNRRDVELLILLDNKLKIIEFYDEIRRYAKCRFEDVHMSNKIIDCMLLSFCKNKFILPTKVKNYDEKIKGAFVFQPKKGLFENIAVADLKSLYPSLIVNFNLSPETYLQQKQDDCINIDDEFFYLKQKGIIPQIVGKLFEERKKFQQLKASSEIESIEWKSYDMIQTAIKVLMNSFYGVLGYPYFRLFNSKIAETVTYLGRRTVKYCMDILKKNNYDIVYGDTDSVFFKIKNIEEGKKVVKIINNELSNFKNMFNIDECSLEMKFEKVFSTVFFSGVKKRYVGKMNWLEGKEVDMMHVVGFEQRRSDSPQIIRDFQKEVFRLILNKIDKETVDKYIIEFIDKCKLMREELGMPIGITKSIESYKNLPIHIRAAKLANKRHQKDFKAGDKIKYIYVKRVPSQFGFENVIAFDDVLYDGYEIDYDRMIFRLIIKKMVLIYDGLDWDYRFLNKYIIENISYKRYINDSINLYEIKDKQEIDNDFQ